MQKMCDLRVIVLFVATIGLLCGMLSEVCHAATVHVVDMSKKWSLRNQNLTISKENIQIPSGVYSALYGEDVLKSKNDVNLRWIAYDNWTYFKKFSVDPSTLDSRDNVNLTFHGIDTIAEIRLNHYLLGRTDNMFVRYTYNVTRLLKQENILEVEIRSPVYAALAKANALEAQNITIPPNCPSKRYKGECHMNMLRKMQASFAWDWGLAAPSMGIWKSVTLDMYELALIRDIDVAISRNDTHWNMFVRVFIDATGNQDFYAELTFYAVELLKKPVVVSDYVSKPISIKSPIIAFEQAIPIDDVIMWWPNGYGDQKLYPLHFTLNAWLNNKRPSIREKTISQKTIRIGFRTIELIEEPAPKGNTFLFKVNGEEIFMKGSNYIPSHILPELGQDRERIKFLLQSAKEANMNMLRVWGGGIYESDYFYDVADSYGLLIWQDMMFACAMYPVTADFLASVRVETIQNSVRIGHHPSIAIFATNNENEVALAQNWYGTFHEKSRFEAEYRELYLATVMHELKIIQHTGRPTALVSSPSNGKESAKDNYLSENPQSNDYGDVHFYDVLKDGWDPLIYPRPRFASEYGYQSLPQMQAWQRILGPNDSVSALISHRQHHPFAMLPITGLVHRHLPLPLPEEPNYIEALIYFSQIAQAMATKVETELYRSLRDTEHRTMGALYWQLNDVWVAPSWSSIDFDGNYKLLHFWAKDFMAPIAITALYDSQIKAINVSLICDKFKVNTEDLKVTMNHYLWSELFPRNSTTWPVTMKPNGVQYDKIIPKADLLTGRFTNNNCFIEFILQRGDSVLSKTHYFPSPICSAVGVADPLLTVTLQSSFKCSLASDAKSFFNSYSLTITVQRPAIFVYIEITHSDIVKYKLSRNGFMQMRPIQTVHLEFESAKCINLRLSDIKVLTVNQFMRN